jgi:hypothetical protein
VICARLRSRNQGDIGAFVIISFLKEGRSGTYPTGDLNAGSQEKNWFGAKTVPAEQQVRRNGTETEWGL